MELELDEEAEEEVVRSQFGQLYAFTELKKLVGLVVQ